MLTLKFCHVLAPTCHSELLCLSLLCEHQPDPLLPLAPKTGFPLLIWNLPYVL